MTQLGLDNRQHAYLALRAVLHALRDHLTVEGLAQFSAQLPLLVRGIFFEGWDPTGKPVKALGRTGFSTTIYYDFTPGFDDVIFTRDALPKPPLPY